MSPLPLLLAALVGLAHAEDDTNSSANCGVVKLFPTSHRDLLRRAATTNTNLYGAVGTAEREVLPLMHSHEGMALFSYEQHVLAGAMHVPVMAIGCESSMLMAPVDLTSSNWALAWSQGDVGVFYNASVTTVQAYGGAPMRGFGNFISSAASIYYALGAPFFPAGSNQYDNGSVTWDWIAGAEVTPGSVAIRAGYVGSNGAYFQASEKHSGAFFAAAANQGFEQLPYLRGGIERLRLEKLVDKVGQTSAYVRLLELPGAVGQVPQAQPEPDDLDTLHLSQEGMGQLIDVVTAVAWKPTPLLHELRVGVHTPHFLGIEERDDSWDFRALGGVVRMPESPLVHVEGGAKPSFRLEAVYGYDGNVFSNLELSLKYNDPEILALFPYAENALDIYFLMQFGQR